MTKKDRSKAAFQARAMAAFQERVEAQKAERATRSTTGP